MRVLRFPVFYVAAMALCAFLTGQQNPVDQQQPQETISRPLTEKQKKKQEERARKELETPYRKWLTEDVKYIITDEERTAFTKLQTDEEREEFIEQFWLRRDPTPDTVENEYKEEHYRRIAYANEHYASGIEGWRTDRGMIYIKYGPPDEIEDHSSGGTYQRPREEGGGETSTYPFQQWRYRYIDGIGTNIIIEFVDTTMTGEFHMTMDPSEKDALLYVPNAGLTDYEQMGQMTKDQRFTRTDGTNLGVPVDEMTQSMNPFNRLDQFTKLQMAPQIKFKDLDAMVNSHITYNVLPMDVRVDYFPVTEASVMTNITLQFQNKNLQFESKDGVQRAVIDLLGRVTSVGRRREGNFEDTVTINSPPEMLQEYAKQRSLYQAVMPLKPGQHRLNVVAKDIVAGTVANYQMALNVPQLDPDKLSSSTLVLADQIEAVPMKNIGTGASAKFVIGSSKVRPRVGETFKKEEKLGIYMKVYNFGQDDLTHKPSGEVLYEVLKNGSNEKVISYTEDLSQIPNISAAQVTVQKLLPLSTFSPGQYTIRLTVTDKISNQKVTQSAPFTVT